jgi:Txe/YoeB family toxin of Txe-Axe toxin-antitoxin module
MLIDSDYKQAVLDMVADETNKNMDREKAKKRFNELLVEFSEKSWIDKYIETQGRSKELSRVEKKVADQFNAMILGTQEDAIRGVNYWEKLTAPNRARVHDQLADGASMADIARLLGDKEL